MSRSSRGEKRLAAATGKEEEELGSMKIAAAKLGARGGKARAAKLAPERRTEIARIAARKRWKS